MGFGRAEFSATGPSALGMLTANNGDDRIGIRRRCPRPKRGRNCSGIYSDGQTRVEEEWEEEDNEGRRRIGQRVHSLGNKF